MNDSVKSLQKLTRFHQRRSNLDSAFLFLKETLNTDADQRIKSAAIVKAFEMAFELCWKCLMDFLEYKGITATSPRDVLKEAFKAGYLTDGQTWIDLLDQRNQLVHIYNENQASEATEVIRSQALPAIHALHERLMKE